MWEALIMYLIGEGTMLFFIYVFIKNTLRKKMSVLDIKNAIEEKKFVWKLTLLSWSCITIIIFEGTLIFTIIMKLLGN